MAWENESWEWHPENGWLVGQREWVICQCVSSTSLSNPSQKCHRPWNPCNCFASSPHINLLIACPKPSDIYVELFGGEKEGRKEEKLLMAAKRSAFHFDLEFCSTFFPKVSWISIIHLSSPDHQKLAVLSCPWGFGVDIRDYFITGNLWIVLGLQMTCFSQFNGQTMKLITYSWKGMCMIC